MVSHNKPYTVATLFFLALFLISIFFFFSTRTTLHPAPSIHSDLYIHLQPLSPPPPLQPLSPPPPPFPSPHSSSATTETQPEPVGDIEDVADNATDAESDAQPVTENIAEDVALSLKVCDLFTGTWVKDESYPIYQPGSCPYVDEAYDCKVNGRTDTLYSNWRWKPDACDLPRYSIAFPFPFRRASMYSLLLLNTIQVLFLFNFWATLLTLAATSSFPFLSISTAFIFDYYFLL